MGCGASSIPKDSVGLVPWIAPTQSFVPSLIQPGEWNGNATNYSTEERQYWRLTAPNQNQIARTERVLRTDRCAQFNPLPSSTNSSTNFLMGSGIVMEQFGSSNNKDKGEKHEIFHSAGVQGWSNILSRDRLTREHSTFELIILSSLSSNSLPSAIDEGGLILGLSTSGHVDGLRQPTGSHPGTLAWLPHLGLILRGPDLPPLEGRRVRVKTGDVFRVQRVDSLAAASTQDSSVPALSAASSSSSSTAAHTATTIIFSHNNQEVIRCAFPFVSQSATATASNSDPEYLQAFHPCISLSHGVTVLPFPSCVSAQEAKGMSMLLADVSETIVKRRKARNDALETAERALRAEQAQAQIQLEQLILQKRTDLQARIVKETIEAAEKLESTRKHREAQARERYNISTTQRRKELEDSLSLEKSLSTSTPEQQRIHSIRQAQAEDQWSEEHKAMETGLAEERKKEDRVLKEEESLRLHDEQCEREFCVRLARVRKEQLEKQNEWTRMLEKRRKDGEALLEKQSITAVASSSVTSISPPTPRPDLLGTSIPVAEVSLGCDPAFLRPTVQVLRPGVILEETTETSTVLGTIIRQTLVNSLPQDLILTMKFRAGGENMDVCGTGEVQGDGSTEYSSYIQSGTSMLVTMLIQSVPSRAFSQPKFTTELFLRPRDRARVEAQLEWTKGEIAVAQDGFKQNPLACDVRSPLADLLNALGGGSDANGGGRKFIDSSFPPLQSVMVDGKSHVHEPPVPSATATAGGVTPDGLSTTTAASQDEDVRYMFLRASSISIGPGSSQIPPSVFSPLSLRAGELTSPAVFSVFSTLAATHPELLSDVFSLNQEHAGACLSKGIFKVRLCVEGVWSGLVIDDLIPVGCEVSVNGGGNGSGIIPASIQGSLWCVLLEKSLAKLYGSYTLLRDRASEEGLLAILTGCPTRSWALQPITLPSAQDLTEHQRELGLLLTRLSEAGQVLMGRTPSQPSSNLTRFGLKARTSYTIFGAFVVSSSSPSSGGSGTDEIVLGIVVPSISASNAALSSAAPSSFSPSSPSWTPTLRARLRPSLSPAKDGVVWISWQEVCAGNVFTDILASMIHSPITCSPWLDRRFTGAAPSSMLFTATAPSTEFHTKTFFTLDIQKECTLLFELGQADEELTEGSSMIDLGLIMFQRDAKSDSISSIDLCVPLQSAARVSDGVLLKPGQYILLPYTSGVRMLQVGAMQKEFTLTAYGDNESAVRSMHLSVPEISLAQKAFIALAKLIGQPTKFGRILPVVELNADGSGLPLSPIPPSTNLGELGTLSRLEHGAFTSFVVALSRNAPGEALITLDATKSTNSSSQRDGLFHSQTLAPGESATFLHIGTVDANKPSSIQVDLQWK